MVGNTIPEAVCLVVCGLVILMIGLYLAMTQEDNK